MTKKLARIAPDHPRAKGNVKWYEDMLEGKEKEGELPPIVNKVGHSELVVVVDERSLGVK